MSTEKFYHKITDELYGKIYSYCFSILKDESNAGDICHDVFVKIKEKINIISKDKSYKSYILTMARNKCIDFLRSQKRLQQNPELINSIEDSSPNPENKYIKNEFDSIVFQSLNKLKDEYKTAIVLRDINHFSYKEIALHMNMTAKRVKWVLNKARRNIKKMVGEYYE